MDTIRHASITLPICAVDVAAELMTAYVHADSLLQNAHRALAAFYVSSSSFLQQASNISSSLVTCLHQCQMCRAWGKRPVTACATVIPGSSRCKLAKSQRKRVETPCAATT